MIVTLNLNKIILFAQEEAERLLNKSVEPEHLFMGILRLGEYIAATGRGKSLLGPNAAQRGADD